MKTKIRKQLLKEFKKMINTIPDGFENMIQSAGYVSLNIELFTENDFTNDSTIIIDKFTTDCLLLMNDKFLIEDRLFHRDIYVNGRKKDTILCNFTDIETDQFPLT